MKLVCAILYLALFSRLACVSNATSTFQNQENWDGEFVASRRKMSANRPFMLLKLGSANPACDARDLGGVVMSRACCVLAAHDRIECFVRGTDSAVYQKSIQISGHTSGWKNLGGAFMSDIECVSRQSGHIDIFGLGRTNNLYVNTFDSNAWSGWVELGGSMMEVPTCVSVDSTRVDCVLRGTTNLPYRISFENGGWGKFVRVGNVRLMQPLGCGFIPSERFDCFTAYEGQRMYQIAFYTKRGWREYLHNYFMPIYGRPSVVWSDPKNLKLFGLGLKNDVQQMHWNGARWVQPSSLGGIVAPDPVCLGLGPVNVHCFVIGTTSGVYHKWWDGKAWSGWNKYSCAVGPYVGPMTCIVVSTNGIICYVRDAKRAVIQIAFRF